LSAARLLFLLDLKSEQFISHFFPLVLGAGQLFTGSLKGRFQFFNAFPQFSRTSPQVCDLALVLLMLRVGFFLQFFKRTIHHTAHLQALKKDSGRNGRKTFHRAPFHDAPPAVIGLQTTIPMLGSCLREFLVNHLIEKVDVAILGASGVTRSQRRLDHFTRLSAGDAY
jgi:hypothetical protein